MLTHRVGDVPRGPLTQEDVDDVEARLEQTSGADGYRTAAADYEAWAAEPHPADEVSVAALLVHAGEALELAGDIEGALAYFDRAVADGGDVLPDARCYVIGALLGLGRHDEADSATAALMQTRPRDPFVYEYVGAGYQMVDRLDEANRWMTAGVVRLVSAQDVPEYPLILLMQSRYWVRQTIGFDEDEYDVLAAIALDPSGADDPDDE